MKANMGNYDFVAPGGQALTPYDNNAHTIAECNYYCKRVNIAVNIRCDPLIPLVDCGTSET